MEADRLLQEANVLGILSEGTLPTMELNMWRQLYSSWALRFSWRTLGTRKATALRRVVTIKVPIIQTEAFSDDASFSWFLNIETKQRLAQIFVAKMALVRLVVKFCSFLLRITIGATSTSNLPTPLASGESILTEMEELEILLIEWSSKYAGIYEPLTLSDMNDDANCSALLMQQSYLKLGHE